MSRYDNLQKTFREDDSGTFETTSLTDSDVSGLLEVRADNREAIKKAMNQAIAKALEEIGLVAEGYAKKACPVDTGRLRNSITHVVDPGMKYVVIGTNVEYAIDVEMGTSKRKEHPFLRPAAANHVSTYASILRSNLGG